MPPAAAFMTPADDNLPWEQRLANYAGDTNKGKSEYQRALQKRRYQLSVGDTAGADASQAWMNQVDTAIGGVGAQPANAQPANSEYKDMLQQVRARLDKPVTPFNYNAQSDPQYQAEMQQAKQNTQMAAGNIAADMNKRGLMNSTITQDRGNQAAAAEYGRLSTEVAPRLRAQAYQEYLGNQQQDRQNLLDTMSAAGALNNVDQQGRDNQYRDRVFEHGVAVDTRNFGYQQGRDTVRDDQWKQTLDYQKMTDQQKMDYQTARDQIMDTRDQRNFDEEVKRYGLDIAMRRAEQANVFANRAADNTRANAAADLAKEKVAWEKDPKNPDNILKQANADKISRGAVPTLSPKQFESEAVTNLKNMTPEMRKRFFDEEQGNIVNVLGIAGLNRMYNQYFDQDGNPK